MGIYSAGLAGAPPAANQGQPAKSGDKDKKSAGPAPDYQQASQADAASSQASVAAQTQQNRPNISTPFATQSWTTGPDGTPQLTAGLAGGLGTGAAALGNQFGAAAANPMDPSLFGAVPGGDAARDQAITSAWNQSTSRLNPMWDQKEGAQRAQLAAQGLDPNGEAARNAMGAMGRDRNDAYASALNSAIGQGTQAGQAVFGQNMASHQQALSDALAQRNAPLQSLGALQGLANGMPQFNQAGLAAPTQSLAAAMGLGNYNLGNQQMQNQATGDMISGFMNMIGSAAGGAAKMSDERLKQNVVRYDVEALPGVPFASWEWKASPGPRNVGVIAQDLQKVAPQYVSEGEGGFLMVDYSFLKGRK